MSKASTETFLKQIQSGKRDTDKQKIYTFIKDNPGTHKIIIIRALKIIHQTTTARISELLDMGVVYISSTKNCSYGPVSHYKVETYPDKIISNKLQRKKERFEKWKKKANEFKPFLSDDLLVELLK